MFNRILLVCLSISLFLVTCSKKSDTPPPPPAPGCTTNSAPVNGSSVSSTNVTLNWTPVTNALSYDIYLGTSVASAAVVAAGITPTSYVVSVPGPGIYYWYVVPKNSSGSPSGCSSNATSFIYSQLPGCITNTAPSNGAFVTSTSITLTWNSSATATSYDLYTGTSSLPTTLAASGITATSYVYNIPATPASATYYWYVVPKNSAGPASGCTSTITSFTYAVIQAPPAFGYYVVGYVPSYRSITSMPDVKFRMTNVVVYAFYAVNSSGTLSAPSSPSSTLVAVRDKARTNNAKVLLGINDGAAGNFKNMASTATGRNNFIKDVMNTVRANNLDGVDMDWEFPTTTDGTDVTFTALMKELSDSLHRDGRYYLSCAITAGKYAGGIRDAIRNEIFPYVDFFNIMAYDDFSSTPGELYRHHSDYTLAQVCLNYWINTRGMPAGKAVLGIPAYGRPSGMTQSGNIVTYSGILTQGGNAQYDSAMVTTTATPTPFKIYYNGQYTTKRKAKLAKDIANGVMFWEKGQDAMDNNSLLKAACDTVGRSY